MLKREKIIPLMLQVKELDIKKIKIERFIEDLQADKGLAKKEFQRIEQWILDKEYDIENCNEAIQNLKIQITEVQDD